MIDLKKRKWLMLPLTLFLAFTLTQCEEEEEPEQELNSATIKGKVTAPLIDTIPGDTNAPQGTQITVWISTEDLVTRSNPSKTYEKKYYQANVNGNGKYSVDVDVNKDPVTVYIEPNDFEVDDYVNPAGEEERRVYTAPDQQTQVVQGDTKIVDIQYN